MTLKTPQEGDAEAREQRSSGEGSKSFPVRWIVIAIVSIALLVLCYCQLKLRSTPYDGMVRKLHPQMSNDAVVKLLGKPYIADYPVQDRVSSIYRVEGEILPFVVQYQSAEHLVLHDGSANAEAWCAYVRVHDNGDTKALVFSPKNLSALDTQRWVSDHGKGLVSKGEFSLTPADPNRPSGDAGDMNLSILRAVGNTLAEPTEDSERLVELEPLKVKLVCHTIM